MLLVSFLALPAYTAESEYGTGPDTQTWGFEKDADGNNIFVKGPTNASTTITVRYDSANPQTQINNISDNSSTPINGAFMNLFKTGISSATGGAIYNGAPGVKLGNIISDFIGNYVKVQGNITAPLSADAETFAYGGAIHNGFLGTVGNITGDFVGNSTIASGGNAEGSNVVKANAGAFGGGIYNNQVGIIGNISGDFVGNSAIASGGNANSFSSNPFANADASGGGIDNFLGVIGNITGDFIGNSAQATGGSAETSSSNPNMSAFASAGAYGGGITNSGTVGNITGNFIGNYAQATAGTQKGVFSVATARGGAINSDGKSDMKKTETSSRTEG